jgi:hypothetical protein
MRDPYDYHAPEFVPDEHNSLRLQETAGTRSATALKEAADGLLAAFREQPEVREVIGDDTAVIVYDGDLYVVGDYIRHLMRDDNSPKPG